MQKQDNNNSAFTSHITGKKRQSISGCLFIFVHYNITLLFCYIFLLYICNSWMRPNKRKPCAAVHDTGLKFNHLFLI